MNNLNFAIKAVVIAVLFYLCVSFFVGIEVTANGIIDTLNGNAQIDWQISRARTTDEQTLGKARTVAEIGTINAETERISAEARATEATLPFLFLLGVGVLLILVFAITMARPRFG